MYAFEEQRAGFNRDAQLRQVDAADARTLAQKVRAEQQKADIEVEYLERTHAIKLRLLLCWGTIQVFLNACGEPCDSGHPNLKRTKEIPFTGPGEERNVWPKWGILSLTVADVRQIDPPSRPSAADNGSVKA